MICILPSKIQNSVKNWVFPIVVSQLSQKLNLPQSQYFEYCLDTPLISQKNVYFSMVKLVDIGGEGWFVLEVQCISNKK